MKYSIGQTSRMVNLPQSVLRFWEHEFKELKPEKTEGGTRKYSDNDIDIILTIKDLLYNQKYTIEGSKLRLKQQGQNNTLDDINRVKYRELNIIIAELETLLKEIKSKE